VGRDNPPQNEAIRFRTLPSLAFPGSHVARLRGGAKTAGAYPPIEMMVTFLGLIGSSGVLPHHYTTLMLKRMREKDHALQDFLDLFQHRFISLFYRAWEKYRLPIAFERFRSENRLRGDDPVTWGVYCFTGLGTDGQRGRMEAPDSAFLYYSGLFAHYPRCASSLETMLSDYFELPIKLLSLQGQWLELDESDVSVVGVRNAALGRTLIAGSRVWDVQGKFRLRVGPLTYLQFAPLMPRSEEDGRAAAPVDGRRVRPALRPLVHLTRTYVGPDLDFDVQAILKKDHVPPCKLGRGGIEARLGYNTWVHSKPMTRDADEAVFSLKEF
jgi:type VI secretion system protein ImpH